jgi:hypothetical protein
MNSFFGTESLQLPFAIQNNGADAANGNVNLDLFLSTTPDLGGSVTGVQSIESASYNINLAPSASAALSVDVIVDSRTAKKLTTGANYYFVAKLSSPTIKESDTNNGTDANNVAVTRQYEYLRVPSQFAVFQEGAKTNANYFDIVINTLNNTNPFNGTGRVQFLPYLKKPRFVDSSKKPER